MVISNNVVIAFCPTCFCSQLHTQRADGTFKCIMHDATQLTLPLTK